MEHCWRCW